MSGDGWETLFNELWGEVPSLLRRWRAPSLGVLSSCQSFIFLLFP